MPVTLFRVRWPDGSVETHYSPSTIIQEYFEVGRSYTLSDFLGLCRRGLNAASDRVASVYGGAGCSRAMAQLAAIEAKAGCETDQQAPVRIEGFET